MCADVLITSSIDILAKKQIELFFLRKLFDDDVRSNSSTLHFRYLRSAPIGTCAIFSRGHPAF